MRLSTNVQVCSHRLNNSYIAKYLAGKEVQKSSTFDFKKNINDIEIKTNVGADPIPKIICVKIWQKSDENKKELKKIKHNGSL